MLALVMFNTDILGIRLSRYLTTGKALIGVDGKNPGSVGYGYGIELNLEFP